MYIRVTYFTSLKSKIPVVACGKKNQIGLYSIQTTNSNLHVYIMYIHTFIKTNRFNCKNNFFHRIKVF